MSNYNDPVKNCPCEQCKSAKEYAAQLNAEAELKLEALKDAQMAQLKAKAKAKAEKHALKGHVFSAEDIMVTGKLVSGSLVSGSLEAYDSFASYLSGGVVAAAKKPETPQEKLSAEMLARVILDQCREFGVMGMTKIAAKSIASFILGKKEAEKAEAKKEAEKNEELATPTPAVGKEIEDLPQTGLLLLKSYSSSGYAQIHTQAKKFKKVIDITDEKAIPLWEPEATAALREYADSFGYVLVTRARLVKKLPPGHLLVEGFGIMRIRHFAMFGNSSSHFELGEWKKYGLNTHMKGGGSSLSVSPFFEEEDDKPNDLW